MVQVQVRDAEPLNATRPGNWPGWLPLVILLLSAFAIRKFLPPWGFMWALAVGIYFGLKWLSWLRVRNQVSHTAWRSAAYLLAWPGMDALSFLNASPRAAPPRQRDWFWAVFTTAIGATLLWAVARAVPGTEPLVRGWVGMVGLILLLHFGSFQMVALGWQRLGVNAKPIMSAPMRSTSLSEFWGKRWNLGFRQLAHDLVFRPLHKTWGVGATGFLVDLVISVPSRGGYGLPTAYFALQGVGVAFERTALGKELGIRFGIRGWLFTAVVTAVPAFWLFHPPFVLRVMIPFMEAIRAL